jgi:hypothetical protein
MLWKQIKNKYIKITLKNIYIKNAEIYKLEIVYLF